MCPEAEVELSFIPVSSSCIDIAIRRPFHFCLKIYIFGLLAALADVQTSFCALDDLSTENRSSILLLLRKILLDRSVLSALVGRVSDSLKGTILANLVLILHKDIVKLYKYGILSLRELSFPYDDFKDFFYCLYSFFSSFFPPLFLI